MKFEMLVKKTFDIKYLRAQMNVRYWEDATVNGEEDDDTNPKIPLRNGDSWVITVDIDTGQIMDWPEGTTAETHYKVCDEGFYVLKDSKGDVIYSMDGYVPSMLAPEGGGYGDYVILKIDENGYIKNWSADLSSFEENARGELDAY